MAKIPALQWAEFQSSIAHLDTSAKPLVTLRAILFWLRKYPNAFGGEIDRVYRFQLYRTIDESLFPVDWSELSPAELEKFRHTVIKYRADQAEGIARLLRDRLEDLLIVEKGQECPNCERWGLGIYFDRQKDTIAYECKQCGYAAYPDGTPVAAGRLSLAGTDDLMNAGILIRSNDS